MRSAPIRRLFATVLSLTVLTACAADPVPEGAPTPGPPLEAQVGPGPGASALITRTTDSGSGTWEVELEMESRDHVGSTVPTPSGPIVVLTDRPDHEDLASWSTIVACLEAGTGRLLWSVSINSGLESPLNTYRAQGSQHEYVGVSPWYAYGAGAVVVSPDGRHVSLQLKANDYAAPADSRTTFVVLDTATGDTARVVEVSGLVLNQALTDTELVVQTAQDTVPAGSGRLLAASLTDPRAEPTSVRTDLWLAGSTTDSVLLSPVDLGTCSMANCAATTITRMTTSGRVIETIASVYRIHSAGRVERYIDPAAASPLINPVINTSGAAEQDVAWLSTRREVLDPATGTSVEITGREATRITLPTAPGLLLSTATAEDTDADGTLRVRATPTGWIAGPGDGEGQIHDGQPISVRFEYPDEAPKAVTVSASPESLDDQ
ncbi:hypothetical protein [Actinomyces howellii]|uniref:PQQ enzyme repeat n=1 Tax=Actinomyces howellii TaxID=52771 RepID=A0A3S4RB81_9ACTO|nr:hypothetical protein [Actinomyces howellii]VEG28585.1 Uncharacterised protein [Actinomyces howellii]